MPLFSFTFDVQPRPGNPHHGRIHSRDVTVWIPAKSESLAAAQARTIVERYEYEIASEQEVREWPQDKVHRKVIELIRRNGYAFEIGPQFPP